MKLTPTLVKGPSVLTTPFLGRCEFEQKEPAPDEVCVPCILCCIYWGFMPLGAAQP